MLELAATFTFEFTMLSAAWFFEPRMPPFSVMLFVPPTVMLLTTNSPLAVLVVVPLPVTLIAPLPQPAAFCISTWPALMVQLPVRLFAELIWSVPGPVLVTAPLPVSWFATVLIWILPAEPALVMV